MDSYREIVAFLEGTYDLRFFDSVIKPRLEETYDLATHFLYAEDPPARVSKYIRSLKRIPRDYIFFADMNAAKCITQRKDRVSRKYRGVEIDKIVVVVKEIEAWYLAGLSANACRTLRIKPLVNTDHIDKEQFENLRPQRFSSGIDFIIEILKVYNPSVAIDRNSSFGYFCRKHLHR